MDKYSFIFNGNDISKLPYSTVWDNNFTDLPERKVNIYKIARADKSVITSAEYESKNLQVWLDVGGCPREVTEEYVSDLKALLQGVNGVAEVLYAGRSVKYEGVLMTDFDITWYKETAYVLITFLASDPIATASDSDQLASVSTTTSTVSANINVDGSFTARPVITLAYTAGSGAGSVTIENAATNQGITISGNFVAGTVVEIDSNNYQVTIDGVLSDFSGGFPVFSTGMQNATYSDTLISRNVTMTINYNAKYA